MLMVQLLVLSCPQPYRAELDADAPQVDIQVFSSTLQLAEFVAANPRTTCSHYTRLPSKIIVQFSVWAA